MKRPVNERAPPIALQCKLVSAPFPVNFVETPKYAARRVKSPEARSHHRPESTMKSSAQH